MNRREKALADKEIDLYKRQQMLLVDKDIFSRKQNNWIALDIIRREVDTKKINVQVELVRLNAEANSIKLEKKADEKHIEKLESILKQVLHALSSNTNNTINK